MKIGAVLASLVQREVAAVRQTEGLLIIENVDIPMVSPLLKTIPQSLRDSSLCTREPGFIVHCKRIDKYRFAEMYEHPCAENA